MSNNKKVLVTMTVDLARKLKIVAAETSTSMSKLVSRAVEEYIRGKKS